MEWIGTIAVTIAYILLYATVCFLVWELLHWAWLGLGLLVARFISRLRPVEVTLHLHAAHELAVRPQGRVRAVVEILVQHRALVTRIPFAPWLFVSVETAPRIASQTQQGAPKERPAAFGYARLNSL